MVSPVCTQLSAIDVPRREEQINFGHACSAIVAGGQKDSVVLSSGIMPVVDTLLPNCLGAAVMDPLHPKCLGVTVLDPLCPNWLGVTPVVPNHSRVNVLDPLLPIYSGVTASCEVPVPCIPTHHCHCGALNAFMENVEGIHFF